MSFSLGTLTPELALTSEDSALSVHDGSNLIATTRDVAPSATALCMLCGNEGGGSAGAGHADAPR